MQQPTDFDFKTIFKKPNLLIRTLHFFNSFQGLSRDKELFASVTTIPISKEFDGTTSWFKTIELAYEPHLLFKTKQDLDWIFKTLNESANFNIVKTSNSTFEKSLQLFSSELKNRQTLFNNLFCSNIELLPSEYASEIKPWILVIPNSQLIPNENSQAELFFELYQLLRIGRSYGLYVLLNSSEKLTGRIQANFCYELNGLYLQTNGDSETVSPLAENIGLQFKNFMKELKPFKGISSRAIFPFRDQVEKPGKVSTPDFAFYLKNGEYVFIDVLGKNASGDLMVQNFYNKQFGIIAADKIKFLSKTRFFLGL